MSGSDDGEGFIFAIMFAVATFLLGIKGGCSYETSAWETRVIEDGAYEWRIDPKSGERKLSPIHVEQQQPAGGEEA